MLVSRLAKKDDVWLSLFQREESVFLDLCMRVLILFTRFASTIFRSKRHVASRYKLSKLATVAGATGRYEYCFSHSKKFSAMILSTECERVGIDIEPIERKISKALELKIREIFPSLMSSELKIIMILECLLKVQPASSSFELIYELFGDGLAEIVNLGHETFEVNFQDKKVYSRIYKFNDFFICITREKNQFPLNL